ncbi:hypothetical protein GEMRC1_006900 [Eukaryota sp. GEM-RC1]
MVLGSSPGPKTQQVVHEWQSSYPPNFGEVKNYLVLPSHKKKEHLSREDKLHLHKTHLDEVNKSKTFKQQHSEVPTSAAYIPQMHRSKSRERLDSIRTSVLEERRKPPNPASSPPKDRPVVIKSGLQLPTKDRLFPEPCTPTSHSNPHLLFPNKPSPRSIHPSESAGRYREPLTVPTTKGRGRINDMFSVPAEADIRLQKKKHDQDSLRKDLDSLTQGKIQQEELSSNQITSSTAPYGPTGGFYNNKFDITPSPRSYNRLQKMFHEESATDTSSIKMMMNRNCSSIGLFLRIKSN